MKTLLTLIALVVLVTLVGCAKRPTEPEPTQAPPSKVGAPTPKVVTRYDAFFNDGGFVALDHSRAVWVAPNSEWRPLPSAIKALIAYWGCQAVSVQPLPGGKDEQGHWFQKIIIEPVEPANPQPATSSKIGATVDTVRPFEWKDEKGKIAGHRIVLSTAEDVSALRPGKTYVELIVTEQLH